jgi:FkbM family methyltransferase
MQTEIKTDEFINIVNHNINNIQMVFEIGSRDGEDSLMFKNAWNNATIYAFEAHPEEYNLHKNLLENKIKWINKAIYDKDGTIDFSIKHIGSGIHSIRNRMIGNKNTIQIPCERLDTFCRKENITTIDVVKIDTEGCTYEVLQGCGNLLSNIKIMHIETESVPYFENQILHADVVKFLEKNNWKMIKMTTADGVVQHDSIWINNNIGRIS